MFLQKTHIFLLISLVLTGCLATSFPETEPASSPGTGLSLNELNISGKNFLIVKIDPALYRLKIIENTPPPDSKNIRDIHLEKKSPLSFNGSFFSQDFQPLGLLVSEGKLLFPLNKSDLMNGLFTINQKGQPELLEFQQFQKNQNNILPSLDFAIQSGPILIDGNGKITADRKNAKKAGRTAIGLDKANNLIVIMLRQTLLDQENALSLYDFAELLENSPQLGPLGLHSVLNLDGGNSSGLAINNQYYPELEKVQNIIISESRS